VNARLNYPIAFPCIRCLCFVSVIYYCVLFYFN